MAAPIFFCQSHASGMWMATPIFAPSFHIVKCPPAAAHGVLPPEPAFGNRGKKPVSVEFHADGEMTATGFSFEEYNFAQTRTRKMTGERRLPTPSWAFNLKEQRELLARFWEQRAGIRCPRIDTPAKRLRYAYRKYMRDYYPKFLTTMKRLCEELVACNDPKRRRELEIEIQGLDTQLRTARQGPGTIVAIIHNYYAVGLDSPGTGAEVGIHPMVIRQTLWRLHKLWRSMCDGTDRKPKPKEIELAKARERNRLWRKKNPEKVAEYQRNIQAARDADREKFRAFSRKQYAENRELRLLEDRTRYRLNPEPNKERARKWLEENKERRKAYNRQWYEKNAESARESARRHFRAHREQILEKRKAERRAQKALAGSPTPR